MQTPSTRCWIPYGGQRKSGKYVGENTHISHINPIRYLQLPHNLPPSTISLHLLFSFPMEIPFLVHESMYSLPFPHFEIHKLSTTLHQIHIFSIHILHPKLILTSGEFVENFYFAIVPAGSKPKGPLTKKITLCSGLVHIQTLFNFCTVRIGYSAIGYSAKSDIVPTSGWYQIFYTNDYWI